MSTPSATSRCHDRFYAAQHAHPARALPREPGGGTALDVCTRHVVTADAAMVVSDAARLMRDSQVGALVVVEDRSDTCRIVQGIVTDRDIALGIVAAGRDPRLSTVRDIMSTRPVTARTGDSALKVLWQMKERHLRRMPVTGPEGELVGMLTLDELVAVFSSQLEALGRALHSPGSREI